MAYHPEYPDVEIPEGYTPTADWTVFIESQTPTSVIYYCTRDGTRWRIDGVCNQCGDCWRGSVDPKPILDSPVTPIINKKFPRCVLSGEYL